VLKIWEQISNIKGSATLDTMKELASTKRRLGKLEEAEVFQRRVVELRHKTGDKSARSLVSAISDLATTRKAQRKLDEAEDLQQQALE
jgi:hypothetical protein